MAVVPAPLRARRGDAGGAGSPRRDALPRAPGRGSAWTSRGLARVVPQRLARRPAPSCGAVRIRAHGTGRAASERCGIVTFAWPWMFLLLPLPWLVWKLLPPAAPGAALRLPQRVALADTATGIRASRWRIGVACAAWLLLVGAAARPQQPAPPQAMHHTGRAMMLAVDCSGSMAIEDMRFDAGAVSRFAA